MEDTGSDHPNAPMLLVEEVVAGEEVQRDDRVRDRTSSERRKTAGDATCMQTSNLRQERKK